jgi:hypothetical protein
VLRAEEDIHGELGLPTLTAPQKYSVDIDIRAANHCDPGSPAHNMSRAQKRSRFVEDTGRKLKKRRKVQNSPLTATIVSHDNLQWREVAVPDRLEDAEGFLGLGIEEIEDVEVIRDPKSSRVQFRVKSS